MKKLLTLVTVALIVQSTTAQDDQIEAELKQQLDRIRAAEYRAKAVEYRAKAAGTLFLSIDPSRPLATVAFLAQATTAWKQDGKVTTKTEEKTAVVPRGSGRAGSSPARWEYKLVVNASEEACNRLGDEGWEMVGYSVNYQPNITTKYMAFKRRKP